MQPLPLMQTAVACRSSGCHILVSSRGARAGRKIAVSGALTSDESLGGLGQAYRNHADGAPMIEQSFGRRNRTLLCVLAAAGIFGFGFEAGRIFSQVDPVWSAPARPRVVRVAVVDDDRSPLSAQIVSELQKVKALDVSEFPERSAAHDELAAGKVDLVISIGSSFGKRVEELDLADIFDAPQGRLDGTLESLGIEVQTGTRVAGRSEAVESLIYSFAVRLISSEVLRRTEPALARKLSVKVMRNRQHADDSR
jgi:hypothetical protein